MKKWLFQGIHLNPLSQVPTQLAAGCLLAMVSIPEVMGYAKIAGLPLVYGLYSFFIPLIIFSLLTSSRYLVVGLDSTTSILLATGLAGLAVKGSQEWIVLSCLLAVSSGILLLMARFINLAWITNLFSGPLLVGFKTGIGAFLAIHELFNMAGVNTSYNTLDSAIEEFIQNPSLNGYTALTSIVAIGFVLLGRRVSSRVPWFLILVILMIWISHYAHLDEFLPIVGPIKDALPQATPFNSLALSSHTVKELIQLSFMMFFIIFLQTNTIAATLAKELNDTNNVNMNLIALSAANIVTGFVSGTVTCGSVSKTELLIANPKASQLSTLTAAALIGVVLVWCSRFFMYLPICVISSIVFLIALKMIKINALKEYWHQSRVEFWIALVIGLSIIVFGADKGLMLGIILTLLNQIRKQYLLNNSLLVYTRDNRMQEHSLHSLSTVKEGVIAYAPGHDLYFASMPKVREELEWLSRQKKRKISTICFSFRLCSIIDIDALQQLIELNNLLHSRGIKLIFTDANTNLKAQTEYHRLKQALGEERFFHSIEDWLK